VRTFRADEWIWDEDRNVLRFVDGGEVVAAVTLTGDALDLWRRTLEAGVEIDEVVAEARPHRAGGTAEDRLRIRAGSG
jgi:hypothetical protein